MAAAARRGTAPAAAGRGRDAGCRRWAGGGPRATRPRRQTRRRRYPRRGWRRGPYSRRGWWAPSPARRLPPSRCPAQKKRRHWAGLGRSLQAAVGCGGGGGVVGAATAALLPPRAVFPRAPNSNFRRPWQRDWLQGQTERPESRRGTRRGAPRTVSGRLVSVQRTRGHTRGRPRWRRRPPCRHTGRGTNGDGSPRALAAWELGT